MAFYLYHAFGADPLPAPLDAIVRRYLVAKQAADEAWERDVAATLVDDCGMGTGIRAACRARAKGEEMKQSGGRLRGLVPL